MLSILQQDQQADALVGNGGADFIISSLGNGQSYTVPVNKILVVHGIYFSAYGTLLYLRFGGTNMFTLPSSAGNAGILTSRLGMYATVSASLAANVVTNQPPQAVGANSAPYFYSSSPASINMVDRPFLFVLKAGTVIDYSGTVTSNNTTIFGILFDA